MRAGAYPLAEQFIAANPLFRRTFERGLTEYGGRMLEVGEMICSLLKQMAQTEEGYSRYLRAFRRFAVEALREQIYAEKAGRNRFTDQHEVYERVYDKESIMESYYLPGMMLSQFAFPNHLALFLFYRDRFLPSVCGGKGFDVGPGHGLLTLELLRQVADAHLVCVDISPVACQFTERVLRVADVEPHRYAVVHGVIEDLPTDERDFSFGVCSKVLEHVPHPDRFLAGVYDRLEAGAPLYLATNVGVGSIDHLQLFGSLDEIRDMVRAAGFAILEELVVPVYPDDPDRAQVVDCALILRKEG